MKSMQSELRLERLDERVVPAINLLTTSHTLGGGERQRPSRRFRTDDTSGPDEVYHWLYTVTNVSLELANPGYDNTYQFSIEVGNPEEITNPGTTVSGGLGVADAGDGTGSVGPGDMSDLRAGWLPGESFALTFDTPAKPIVLKAAAMSNALLPYIAVGMVEAPAVTAATATVIYVETLWPANYV